ncbi:MAG TPA: glycosyltransferase family 2 protein [Elusimicrobiales bacterium]|nr:glycosyltransferase family 2 protein [Elusimicrobiales bacterium]
MKLSILMPAYNEERTLAAVLDSLAPELKSDFEVVAVDDGSRDGTLALLKQAAEPGRYPFPIKVLAHEKNSGKGAAIRTAAAAAEGAVLIIQDADLEYHPRHIPQLIAPILDGRADIVYGSRLSAIKNQVFNIFYLWGNQSLTWLTNLLCGSSFTDSYTGYKAFRREILQGIDIKSRGFELEGELSVKVALGGWRFMEMPITYKCRSRSEGKKINGRDAVKGILTIIKTWLSERRRLKQRS